MASALGPVPAGLLNINSMLRRLLVPLAALALAVGCNSGDGKTVPPGADAPAASPTSSQAPQPADGTDLAACADAACEVSAVAGSKLTFPASTRIESITVQSVEGETVVLTGRTIGNRNGGGCTGRRCEASSTGNEFKVTLEPVSATSQNALYVTLQAVSNGAAILKIEPA